MSQRIKTVREIKVGINFGAGTKPVGRLAIREQQIYFQYASEFIEASLEISPVHLPLKPGVSHFDYNHLEGLPGVFNDSLPDGWGRLLFDRFARSQGLFPSEVTPLDRLAYIGENALGALVYEPDFGIDEMNGYLSLDQLALQAQAVLDGVSDDVLESLIELNGSSAGARPKALIGFNKERSKIICGARELPGDYEPWMVKFPNTQDGLDAGAIEYVYALMAKDAGIVMPEVLLFPAQRGPGYFAVKRFDRVGNQRYHTHTACGLLHADFRNPLLDYEDLIALTSLLTRDVREVEKMYKLAVFNVLSHNRDDHGKNFSFVMDQSGRWTLSAAYDLTFSSGPRGEQSTMVMGEGRNPGIEHLMMLAKEAGISKKPALEIINIVKTALAKWSDYAKEYGVSQANIKSIEGKISRIS